MKKFVTAGLLLAITLFSFGQSKTDALLSTAEATRIEGKLSSDDMRGRRAFGPDIDKAAAFIEAEFAATGLQTWKNSGTYRQEFAMIKPKFISATAVFEGVAADQKNLVVITTQPVLKVNQQSGFEKVSIKPGAELFKEAYKYVQSNKNYLVCVDTSFSKTFPRLAAFKRNLFKSAFSVVFVLTANEPVNYQLECVHEMVESALANVVGVLPGKSKKDEYVIFSGHYDHLGVGKPVNGDSIFNGANDDAAGTTAVIMLAKYYKALGNNERTIVFAAFTAEEAGGFGSQYFSRQFEDASKIIAMFNIEMIGTDSKWGNNSAYITGYEKTDMGKILEKNLQGSAFKFYPDPYPEQDLFYRSDNATLARLGVPAHTISTSKMDDEPNYHKVTDEIGTLDMENMARVIKAIAISATSIINGKDAPSRVNKEDLK